MLQGPPLTSPDVTATIGFMLTLIGLIGTFFYVQLSNWLREILELNSKWELNKIGDTEPRKQGRLECKFQLRRLLNHIPALIAILISIFIIALIVIAKNLIAATQPQPAVVPYYKTAAIWFLIIYFSLTIYLLLHGYIVGYKLKKKIG
jgi:hypothetical protein